MRRSQGLLAFWMMIGWGAATPGFAQGPGQNRPPEFSSLEVSPERKVTFRIFAPKSQAVRLGSSDIPGLGPAAEMKKADNGVWETTVGPVPAGAYRYHFQVDGVSVVDPRNPATSESNANTWSLAIVPGSEAFDLKEVPHGAVASVPYYSSSLKKFRRMHVYTPPGYDKGQGEYPVFYLLHGAMDSDDSWNSVGRAGVILDNLIASGKAKPMIVVMPGGHTGRFMSGPGGNSFQNQMEEFSKDFAGDVRPYIEKNYRAKTGRADRAIAGLSMGGAQTLNVAFDKLEDYGYIGVFSSGVLGIAGGFGGNGQPNTQWEDAHKSTLDNADLKSGTKLVWFACGKDDFLVQTSKTTVDMLKKHKFDVVSHDTDGGHTWLNWRDYLSEFAPKLFQEK